jgi:hypothetical protein
MANLGGEHIAECHTHADLRAMLNLMLAPVSDTTRLMMRCSSPRGTVSCGTWRINSWNRSALIMLVAHAKHVRRWPSSSDCCVGVIWPSNEE